MLRLTRIQFDLLTALARSQGSAAKASGILEAMAVMGHALDSAGLQSCAVLLNRELVVEGWKLQNSSAGVILSAASFEERLPFLNLALLEALSTILINARIYQEGHQAVSAFSERAVEILSELGRGQAVLIEARQGALTVNGIVPAPGAASPEAVVEFMKSFGIKGFLCEPGLRASDLAGLAKLSKLAALKAAPEDPGAFLRAAGIVSLQLRRERIDDSGESKRLILEYARRMGADRDSACELFGEDAAFILRTRGKERIFEGRAAIRGVLSSYPKDLLFQVTGHGGSGDEFTAVCVVSGGMQALVKDEYKFTVIGGLFARFEASTRLRF